MINQHTNLESEQLPGDGMNFDKMPGHWLLAQMGKRVLRPGGIELTQQMLDALAVTANDHVVEFAPGLGVTAQLALANHPASYTAVEADSAAADSVTAYLNGDWQRCVVGKAEATGLLPNSATVLYGEAMLTMHSAHKKVQIIQEAKRLLQSGDRYGIHELCLTPDHLDDRFKQEIQKALSSVIRVNARPLTVSEWRTLFESEGFRVTAIATNGMHLLRFPRMIQDEGLGGTLRIARNIMRTPAARKRVLAMRSVFQKYQENLGAVMLVVEKAD